MGETAKKAAGLTALAVGAYFTGGALLTAYGATTSTVTFGTALAAESTGLLLGLGGAAAGSALLGSAATSEALEFEKEQAKLEMELAKLAGRQDVLAIEDEKRRLRQIAKARAAGQGKDISSIRAFITELDKRAEDDKTNSRLNALSRTRSSRLQIASLSSRQTSSTMTGLTGASRSLLTTAISIGKV